MRKLAKDAGRSPFENVINRTVGYFRDCLFSSKIMFTSKRYDSSYFTAFESIRKVNTDSCLLLAVLLYYEGLMLMRHRSHSVVRTSFFNPMYRNLYFETYGEICRVKDKKWKSVLDKCKDRISAPKKIISLVNAFGIGVLGLPVIFKNLFSLKMFSENRISQVSREGISSEAIEKLKEIEEILQPLIDRVGDLVEK